MYTSYLHNRKSQPKQCLLPWSGARSASPQWGCWVSVTAMPVVLIIKPVITHDPGGAGQLALCGHTQKTDCKQALWTIMTMWSPHGGRRCYTQAAPVHVRWHASEGWSTCMGVLNMVSSDKLRWILNYIHILLVMTNYICMNIWCLLILITSNWSTSPHA